MATEQTIYLPPFPIVAKPKLDQACNGCGWCCHEEICMAGKVFLELVDEDKMIPHFIKGPCPLMEFEQDKVRCGLVQMESRMNIEPIIANALGIGKGCDADDPITYEPIKEQTP